MLPFSIDFWGAGCAVIDWQLFAFNCVRPQGELIHITSQSSFRVHDCAVGKKSNLTFSQTRDVLSEIKKFMHLIPWCIKTSSSHNVFVLSQSRLGLFLIFLKNCRLENNICVYVGVISRVSTNYRWKVMREERQYSLSLTVLLILWALIKHIPMHKPLLKINNRVAVGFLCFMYIRTN